MKWQILALVIVSGQLALSLEADLTEEESSDLPLNPSVINKENQEQERPATRQRPQSVGWGGLLSGES
jgi:hypothetical protein